MNKYKIKEGFSLCFDNVNVLDLKKGDTYEPQTRMQEEVFAELTRRGKCELYVEPKSTPAETKVSEPEEKTETKPKSKKKTQTSEE